MKIFEDFSTSGKLESNEWFVEKLNKDVIRAVEVIDEKRKREYINKANVALKEDIPHISASLYKQFALNGNRQNFQDLYYKRRIMLTDMIYGELCEQKGRFYEKMQDVVWSILEESTWIVPAHNTDGSALRFEYEDVKYVDLFSGATGALISVTYALFGDKLDVNTSDDTVKNRMMHSVKQRILIPFEKYSNKWWYTGLVEGHLVNNWNPWIFSNILFALSVFEDDLKKKEQLVDKILMYTDNFLDTYPADGGCNEGPSYWSAAGGAYFDFLHLVYTISDKKIDMFSVPLVYNMGDYIHKMHIDDGYFVNFADCAPKLSNSDPVQVYRFGKHTKNEQLMSFACEMNENVTTAHNYPLRTVFNFIEGIDCKHAKRYIPQSRIFMNGTQVYIFRNENYVFAVKGGHNRESHNHNDVGHFIYYKKGLPVIIDAGLDTYSKITFSDKRYTMWHVQSGYHNLPDIAGFSQPFGSMYKAGDISYDENENTLSMQLKDAYPEQAGLLSYIRKVSLSDDKIEITDDISMNAHNEVTGHLMMPEQPDITGNVILLKDTSITINDDASISYEPVSTLNTHGLNADKPQRDLMTDSWGDNLYRVNIRQSGMSVLIKYTISGRK